MIVWAFETAEEFVDGLEDWAGRPTCRPAGWVRIALAIVAGFAAMFAAAMTVILPLLAVGVGVWAGFFYWGWSFAVALAFPALGLVLWAVSSGREEGC